MSQYKSLTEIGQELGVSRNKVGKILKDLGLRTPDGRPAPRAFEEHLVAQRGSTNPNTYYYVWNEAVIPLVRDHIALKKAGKAPSHPPLGTNGHEILDQDGQVIAWAVDDYWATLIARALSGVANEA